jgi:hypothetical protein
MVFSACNATDKLTSPTDTPADTPEPTGPTVDEPSLSSAFRGGIPIGTFHLPTSQFNSQFNGALRNIWPGELNSELRAIKARGGKIVLMMAGNERWYKTNGHFDLGKWKARVARFRGTNFSSYVKDGTIIAHYLIDEPTDPFNWGGRPISPATIEEMARYSKQLWPNMPTVVRAEAGLIRWSKRYRYLDAAWAQYVTRKGDPNKYIRRVVSDAQHMGLGLVVGLNLTKGGPNKRKMSASQARTVGAALLSSNYPCAFISWQYDARQLASSAMKETMRFLRAKAQNRSQRSCRG